MSDSEIESRTNAVGRKRNVHGELKTPSYPTSRRSSKASSKESGEISSSSESGSEDEAEAPNKRSRPSPGNTAITISSSSEDGEVSESHEDSSSSSDEAQKRPHLDVNMSSDDNSDSDSDSDSNFSHGISKMASEADDMVRLHQLSRHDRADQKFYFNLTSPEDFVYCLCCGERGHIRTLCPARKCSHCGAFESHISSACPKYRKCGRCRQRGHDSRDCQNKSYQMENDPCDICGEIGHIEETCSRLWCFPTITPLTATFQKIPEQAMLRGCYSCGSREHWGDDCRYVRRDDLNSVKTWNAKNAERFILRQDENDDDDDEYEPPQPHAEEYDEDSDPLAALESGLREGSGEYVEAEDSGEEYEPAPAAAPTSRPWQMGLFDDTRD